MNFKPLLLAASIVAIQPASAQQPDAKAIMEGARMSASLSWYSRVIGSAGSLMSLENHSTSTSGPVSPLPATRTPSRRRRSWPPA